MRRKYDNVKASKINYNLGIGGQHILCVFNIDQIQFDIWNEI